MTTSYGASGDQSRGVVDGKPADIVNFSVEPDVTRLVKADKVAKDWNADATKGIPFGSVVSLVVRKGNPKGIKDWDDLLKPGIEVVTPPSPLSSGSAKWNLLAPYAAKSNGGKDSAAGLDFIDKLVTEHVKTRPGSGREATDVFLQGTGDVLISYENEAINVERQGKDVEHVNPPQTFKIENPVAVVSSSAHLQQATALKNFLYTADGQKLWAEAGFRPVDPAVVADFAKDFPTPGEAVDDRGPGRLEGRRPGAVRQGQRQHHHDLQAGHRMTSAVTDGAPGASVPPGRPGSRGPPGGSAPPRYGWGAASIWLSVIVLLPLAAILWQSAGGGWTAFWQAVTSNAALESFKVTVTISVGVTLVNLVFGLLVAWTLTRDSFPPGKRLVDAVIDCRSPCDHRRQPGDVGALRAQQPGGSAPAAHQMGGCRGGGAAVRHAAVRGALGATRAARTGPRGRGGGGLAGRQQLHHPDQDHPARAAAVVVVRGAGLAFSRAIGEFGSVVLIGGAVPGKTEVSSQWIRTLIENDDRTGAAAISIVLLLVSFVVLFILRAVGSRAAKREELAK